ncbi:MAG TPA: hypothetical protein VGK77_25150 [Candidatus Binatia bacterium]
MPKVEIPTKFTPKKIRAVQGMELRGARLDGGLQLANLGQLPANGDVPVQRE